MIDVDETTTMFLNKFEQMFKEFRELEKERNSENSILLQEIEKVR